MSFILIFVFQLYFKLSFFTNLVFYPSIRKTKGAVPELRASKINSPLIPSLVKRGKPQARGVAVDLGLSQYGLKIQRALRLLHSFAWHAVGIDHSRFHAAVAKKLLDSADVVIRLQEVCREGVAEGMAISDGIVSIDEFATNLPVGILVTKKD